MTDIKKPPLSLGKPKLTLKKPEPGEATAPPPAASPAKTSKTWVFIPEKKLPAEEPAWEPQRALSETPAPKAKRRAKKAKATPQPTQKKAKPPKVAKTKAKKPPVPPQPSQAKKDREKRKNAQRQGWKEFVRVLVDECFARRFPVWAEFKPLAVGFHEVLFSELGLTPREIFLTKQAIKRHVNRAEYHRAVAAGGPRYRLDGTVDGEVTEEQRQYAGKALADLDKSLASGDSP